MSKSGENIHKRRDGRWEGRYIKGRTPDRKPVLGIPLWQLICRGAPAFDPEKGRERLLSAVRAQGAL